MSALALQRDVLMINDAWEAVGVTRGFTAIHKMHVGSAEALDANSAQTYDFDSWVETWNDARRAAEMMEDDKVRSQHVCIPVPEIIVLKNYKGNVVRGSKLTRAAIFNRDQNQCQYCGKVFPRKDLNIDHVLPKARGGRNTWTNLVLSCIECNTVKGCRTPAEADMPLIRDPYEPTWAEVQTKFPEDAPASWEEFLAELYWNVGIT